VTDWKTAEWLYALCGMGWFYRGSLADLRQGVRTAVARR
jgi:hypothetical protein